MEKTEAGLKGLYIREITLKQSTTRLYNTRNSYSIFRRHMQILHVRNFFERKYTIQQINEIFFAFMYIISWRDNTYLFRLMLLSIHGLLLFA